MMIFILLLLSSCNADEVFENIEEPCKICTCSEIYSAQIININCSNQNFKHMLSKWPITNATTINAFFTGQNISSLETLPPTDSTVEIVLSKCNIKSLYSNLLSNAKNTRTMDLSYNELTGETLSSKVFVGPYHEEKITPIALESLNLAYNKIHSLNKDVFEHLPNLKRLNLEGNYFRILDVHTQLAVSSLTNIAEVNLANNALVDLVQAAIEKLEKLVLLDLSKNLFDFVPSSLRIVGNSLKVLIVDANPIIELKADSFQELFELQKISAKNLTKLTYVGDRTFASLPKLISLDLSDNSLLETIDENAFGNDSSIHELYLNNDKLQNISYSLIRWSKIEIFEISDNPLQCSCDLYNITRELSSDIIRNENGPDCTDPRTELPLKVFRLKSDICEAKPRIIWKQLRAYNHISIPLAGLIATLVAAIFVAMILGYSRYRKFIRNRNYPFASQVLYNPISN